MKGIRTTLHTAACLVGLALILTASPAAADHVILDDCIIDGSLCVGFDCVNGESFGFDTIRLKENNLRIDFTDTSTAASFPPNDWGIVINDSANGGASYFGVEDRSAGRMPFRVLAGARANALVVDAQGDIGIGTLTPVADVHIKTGDTPTLRLEQDGTSGFQPQTWDVAGNETNFFIRDVTSGSTLPLRIRPGAPSSSIDIAGDGDVGIGTGSPSTLTNGDDASMHVRRTDGTAGVLIEETGAADQTLMELRANGAARLELNDTATSNRWIIQTNGPQLQLSSIGSGGVEFILNTGGDLVLRGDCTEQAGADQCGTPDYVFEPGYEYPSLDELAEFIEANGHLPNVPSREVVETEGLNMRRFTWSILEKVEELVLYTLEQQETIGGQQELISDLQGRLAALEASVPQAE